jgi:hypothetical protein
MGGSRGRRGWRDSPTDASVLRRPSLTRRASRAPTDQGRIATTGVSPSGEDAPDRLRSGVHPAGFVHTRWRGRSGSWAALSALLVQPLSERIQKRYRVPLPDHAPRPGGQERCARRSDRPKHLRCVSAARCHSTRVSPSKRDHSPRTWMGRDAIMRSGHTHRPRELGAGGGRLRIIGHWALEALC